MYCRVRPLVLIPGETPSLLCPSHPTPQISRVATNFVTDVQSKMTTEVDEAVARTGADVRGAGRPAPHANMCVCLEARLVIPAHHPNNTQHRYVGWRGTVSTTVWRGGGENGYPHTVEGSKGHE